MLLIIGLIALLNSSIQLPSNSIPVPLEVCTITGLNLITTSLSESAAWNLAYAKWGKLTFQRRLKLGGVNYSIVELGFRTVIDGNKDPERCLIGFNCFQNRVGSWRKLWNSILIDECKRRQGL